jgi:hypothetical protein
MRAAAACCMALLGCVVESAPPESAGVWYMRRSTRGAAARHEQLLTISLRRTTGVEGLRFDADGRLVLDGAPPLGGSSVARELLARAQHCPIAFLVEDHSGSGRVDFGQLDAGTVYEDARTFARMEVRRLRLDFLDFERAQAPAPVRASFDVGFTFLHELLHGFGCADAPSSEPEAIGECEQVLNRARDELGLPRRERYFAEAVATVGGMTTVRLPFRAAGNAGDRAYFVFATAARSPATSALGSVAGVRRSRAGWQASPGRSRQKQRSPPRRPRPVAQPRSARAGEDAARATPGSGSRTTAAVEPRLSGRRLGRLELGVPDLGPAPQAEPLHLLAQRRRKDAERTCGAALMAAARDERLRDQPPLVVLEQAPEVDWLLHHGRSRA